MIDGIVELDSEIGKKYGFVSDKFGGYLRIKGGEVWVSFIQSLEEGKGNLSSLLDKLEKDFNVIVPTPLGRMRMILAKRGYETTNDGESELMVKNR